MSMHAPTTRLRLGHWNRLTDDHDRAIVSRCVGPTLDVGCGPGRLTAALAERGHVTLGIDVVSGAIGMTRDRGAPALRRDVFDRVPGEGRWETALLADGNIGIGGDPVGLLRRLRQVVDPRGRIVVELAAPGTEASDDWASLELAEDVRVVPWSIVGVDDADGLARDAGLEVIDRLECCSRWCVILEAAA